MARGFEDAAVIGQTIGDYRITDKLGEGGFGVVYKAVELSLDRVVALKTMDALLARDSKFRGRFFAEAKVQAKLGHPNIVTIHRFFEHEGQYFIAMEYLKGMLLPDGSRAKTLADFICLGPVSGDRLVTIFGQVLDAVGCAHEQGVLHRDIKPLNILFTSQGIPKVADFGIAKIVGGDTNVSLSGTRVGTPTYMSPEQVWNDPLDRRSDIYSLGVTLYEMAVGEAPFKATNTTSIERQHSTVPPPPPRERNPDVAVDLERVILKAMAKKPEDRYQDCDEFKADIEAQLGARRKLLAVPGVTGMPRAGSEEILRRAGFVTTVVEEHTARVPMGRVAWQEPEPTSLAVAGTTVTLFVSSGHADEVGLRQPDASPSTATRPGVASAGPAPVRNRRWLFWFVPLAVLVLAVLGFLALGRKSVAAHGGRVMPDLNGITIDQAQARLAESGLQLHTIDSNHTSDTKRGTVAFFWPPAGSLVSDDDTVQLVYSVGPTRSDVRAAELQDQVDNMIKQLVDLAGQVAKLTAERDSLTRALTDLMAKMPPSKDGKPKPPATKGVVKPPTKK